MSVITEPKQIHQEPPRQLVARHVQAGRWLVLVGILAAVHLPLLVAHFTNLWRKPHYQYVALLPVGIGLLALRGWREHRDDGLQAAHSWWHTALAGLLLAVAVAISGVATWMWSPWIAMLSLLTAVLAVILLAGGGTLARRLLPAWILAWMAVPLPVNFDLYVIIQLRQLATQWTSAVLDQLGVLHLVSGNVIELPGKQLFVADACSGIHSLFVILASALFFGLWTRRRPLHVILLLFVAGGVVLVENVARLSTIAAAAGWQVELSEGWPHTLLGLVLFAASLGLLASSDQLLAFLLTGRSILVVPLWHRLRGRKSAKHRKQVAGASPSASPLPLLRPARSALVTWSLLAPLMAAFLVIGAFQYWLFPSRGREFVHLWNRSAIEFPDFGETLLPAEKGGWRRTHYDALSRGPGHPMAKYTQVWRYEKNGVVASIHLDYPYPRAHDLVMCYNNTGWSILERAVVEAASAAGTDHTPVARALMKKPLYGHGFLLFSSCDVEGNSSVPAGLSMVDRFSNRVGGLPCFQVQMFVNSRQALDKTQQQELQALFGEVREKITARCLEQLQVDE